MQILFLASDPGGVGGIQRHNKNILRASSALGASLEVLVRENFKSSFSFVLAAMRIARKNKAVLWCGHIRFAPVGWLLSFFGYRYLAFTHGVDVWNMNSFERQTLKRAFRVVVISHYTKDKILAQCPFLKDKIVFLYPAVDGKVFFPQQISQDFLAARELSESKIILTVCRLDQRERYKGYDRVLRAMPGITAVVPNAKYLLVGSGDDLPRIKVLAEELGVVDKLIVIENADVSTVAMCYSAADVFIMPSTGEGFGIVYLEAAACGTPVIAGNKDGSVDAMLGGELGLLIDPEDIRAIRTAVIDVLKRTTRPELLDGRILREKALAAYGLDKFTERVADLIRISTT
jgi:glycosyltransferase involved in cell wall biosynthesis